METGASDGHLPQSWTILDDMDYADDIGLLSSRHNDMQENMDRLTTTAPQVGLKLNTAKIKLVGNNYKTDNPITINSSDALEEVQDFAYRCKLWKRCHG